MTLFIFKISTTFCVLMTPQHLFSGQISPSASDPCIHLSIQHLLLNVSCAPKCNTSSIELLILCTFILHLNDSTHTHSVTKIKNLGILQDSSNFHSPCSTVSSVRTALSVCQLFPLLSVNGKELFVASRIRNGSPNATIAKF